MSLTVGSLFAGIGGFDLAAERCGMQIRWQVEIVPFRRGVLEKHWPHVKRYSDIRRLRYPAPVDIVCGGFPCQDISSAGGKAGIDGPQSGLWAEMFRVVRAVRPRYVVVENSADLVSRGLERVIGDLASIGYDAEWDGVQAAAVGAPHGRDRLWIVAYPHADEGRRQKRSKRDRSAKAYSSDRHPCGNDIDGLCADLPDADGAAETAWARRWTRARVDFKRWRADARQRARWETEPDVCRVADGVSPGLDNARLAALGDSIVPQIAEWIFKRILEAEAQTQGHRRRTVAG